MKSVAVLMSTYNGEKFLREQLDSILAQEGVRVSLFVRDDGSSDGTEKILAEYAERDARVRYRMCENVGVGNSFMRLLYDVPDTFDYYAFSDQDDIWLPEKLSEGIAMLEASGKQLYGCNQILIDGEGKLIREKRFLHQSDVRAEPEAILSFNPIAGSGMVFTNQFYKLLCKSENRPSSLMLKKRVHDVWIAMVASLHDSLIYDDRAFYQYRQHGNNVAGALAPSRWKVFQSRLDKIFHKEKRNSRSYLANEVMERFPEQTSKHAVLLQCIDGKSFQGKKSILRCSKTIRTYSEEKAIVFLLKVLMGWF